MESSVFLVLHYKRRKQMILFNNIQIQMIRISWASGPMPLKSCLLVERRTPVWAGARFGGNSNNDNCSARNLNANNLVSNTSTNYAGSAKVVYLNTGVPAAEDAKLQDMPIRIFDSIHSSFENENRFRFLN